MLGRAATAMLRTAPRTIQSTPNRAVSNPAFRRPPASKVGRPLAALKSPSVPRNQRLLHNQRISSVGTAVRKQWYSTTEYLQQRLKTTSVGRLGNNSGKIGVGNTFHREGRSDIPPFMYLAVIVPTATGAYVYYKNLDTVPITERSRWIATSPDLEARMGHQEYRRLLRDFQGRVLPRYHRASVTVERVGSRIADSALEFAEQHNLTAYTDTSKNAKPTFTVVQSSMANAFVLPGNHIFVMSGLFRYAQTEDELAAVLGHEMAHTLARHAGERMSGGMVRQILANLSLLIDPTGALLFILLPASNLLRDLPHSRMQELEADQIGLHVMAKACYDPRAAKVVFSRMKFHHQGRQPPAFLSTHPSHDQRLVKFDEWLPVILEKEYDRGHCESVRRQMEEARRYAAMVALEREAFERGK